MDVGCACPAHAAIPLDFSIGSPVHTSIFLVFKLKWENDIIKRYHARHKSTFEVLCPDELESVSEDDILWQWFYDIRDCDIETICTSIKREYEDLFLRKLVIAQFLDGKMCGLRHGQSESSTGQVVYFEYSAKGRLRIIVDSDEELFTRIKQLLPNHSEETIHKALAHRNYYLEHPSSIVNTS